MNLVTELIRRSFLDYAGVCFTTDLMRRPYRVSNKLTAKIKVIITTLRHLAAGKNLQEKCSCGAVMVDGDCSESYQ